MYVMYEKYLIKFIKTYFEEVMPKICNRSLAINDLKKIDKKINYLYGCYNRDFNIYGELDKSKTVLDMLYKAKNNAYNLMYSELTNYEREFLKCIQNESI